MCECKDIKMGSYDNTSLVVRPEHMRHNKDDNIYIDNCIKAEVEHLWSLGIRTTGNCCGHNIKGQVPTIAVTEEDVSRMKELGYVVYYNPCRPSDDDIFIAQSVPLYP